MINLKCRVENPNQIMDMLANGTITPVEAFILFEEIGEKKAEPIKPSTEEKIEDILKELDSLVGLPKVKQLVKEIQAFVEIQKRRQKEQLISEPLVLHMIFKGNPGTGKTTVARLLGKIFKQMEVLQKGHLVEVERADLVGEYIGHTAQKTREQIRRALGGILFIDEAYSLARGGEKDFGKEAIDTLVKAMEDHKDNLIVILAGYKDEMDWFLRTNPGLRSRFPIQIEFSDYTIEELMEIAKIMVEKRQYKLTPEALAKLERLLKDSKNSAYYDKMGNARLVRNLIEKAIRRQALRLVNQKRISREDLIYIKEEDISEVEEI
ncbi:stage V sporulation protein K [Thermosediminibacter litoriperuensis]|uniref:Stage V sporulation protein K n=1 Tax=Thermosediminibacter litoriperuensis TaxID=291989 RepID=A0A5S5AGM2_9FIRM|nr:stage V sporulation protein K [Thermosediminibacter litoriperuensis]TYP48688.1 stage V sporulation protein K [Thermosediminibacter litoriperuensis]